MGNIEHYILAPFMQLAGYDELPFGICNMKTRQTEFLNRELYEVLLLCDGKSPIDRDSFTDLQNTFLNHQLKNGYVLPAEEGQTLQRYQRYEKFDNRYKGTVHLSITGDCNYRCKHCMMSAPDAKFHSPSFEQLSGLFAQMEECGIKAVSLTGGEPLFRKDFYELLEVISKHHIAVSGILTNGALVNDKLFDELEKHYFMPVFQLSFDGVGWHDWLRGVEGAEKRVIEAMKLIKNRGLIFNAAMTLHKRNAPVIRDTVNLLAELGCNSLKVNIAEAYGDWLNYPEEFLSFEESLPYYLSYIPEFFEDGAPMEINFSSAFSYKKASGKSYVEFDKEGNMPPEKCAICGAMREMIYISPEGTALPCQSLMCGPIYDEYPNVFETPLKEILNDSRYSRDAFASVKDYFDYNPDCKNCEFAKKCKGGCRATAIGGFGTDYFAPDPTACTFFKNGWHEKFSEAIGKYALS